MGGVRYDDLVATLGGRKDTPATGFAYGLERLRLALEQEENPLGQTPEQRRCPSDSGQSGRTRLCH
ncbi:hypothetical protein [Neosynechococcus sphagnicola]|uniref:hypothetical protein n=1 Tax=Neosynechococcus sphagnicola TaxID=1501145 RepID=UPI00068BCCD7|nr:hypothetical protein [Neosynechococcus sphagnicola]